MRLLLIRHGQTPNNVLGALDTARPGAALTRLGHAQAAAIPRVLADEDVRAVYASPLTRTQLTGSPLAKARGAEIEVTEGIEEIVAGDYEMRTDMPSVMEYLKAGWSWATGDLSHAVPGGENGHEFFERFDAAVAKMADAHGDETVAAVSHGAAIRVWSAARAVNVDPAEAIEWPMHNTGLSMLEGDPERGWTLTRWHGDPLGGTALEDELAHDVTGDPDETPAPA